MALAGSQARVARAMKQPIRAAVQNTGKGFSGSFASIDHFRRLHLFLYGEAGRTSNDQVVRGRRAVAVAFELARPQHHEGDQRHRHQYVSTLWRYTRDSVAEPQMIDSSYRPP